MDKFCLDCKNYRVENNNICVNCVNMDEFVDKDYDKINNPSHYNSHPSRIECIDIVKHHDFCTGNAMKYLWRAGLKDGNSDIQDLKKAVWYINQKIKDLEGKK